MLYYPWQPIDLIIENEISQSSYNFVSQLDNSLFDILDLVLQFCFLTFFGLAFPLVGLLAFFGGICDIHMDKYRLMHLFRRPFPLTTGSLGLWNNIFEIIIFSSIVINAVVYSFTLRGLDEEGDNPDSYDSAIVNLPICILIIVIFVIIKFAIEFLSEFEGGNNEIISKRHKFISNLFVEKKGTQENSIARAGICWKFSSKEIKSRFCSDEIV